MDEMQTGQKVEEAKPKGMFLVIIVASLVVGLVIGYAVGLSVRKVSDQISLTKNDLEYIEYDYDQPSLPPESRQSFIIRVEKDTIGIKQKYSDDKNWKSFPLAENDLNEILSAVKNIDFNKQYSEDFGCTGGVTKALTLRTKISEFKVDVYVCSLLSRSATLELDAAAAMIASKIPDFEAQLMRD